MAEWDVNQEVKSLGLRLRIAEAYTQSYGGSESAARLVDEIHNDLCHLTPSQRQDTLAAYRSTPQGKNNEKLTDGAGNDIGFFDHLAYQPAYLIYVPLRCNDGDTGKQS